MQISNKIIKFYLNSTGGIREVQVFAKLHSSEVMTSPHQLYLDIIDI